MSLMKKNGLSLEGPAFEVSRHGNSFDFIRFLAAGAVVVGHHKALNGGVDPALPLVNDTLPGLAVCVFFCISGFLIFNSLVRDSRPANFFAARLARIVPNLFISWVIVSSVMMIWFENYRNLDAHINYVWNNARMFSRGVQFTIPGVLEGRPLPGPNGSLWTLPYEFWMYITLFVIFLFRQCLRRPILLLAFLYCSWLWITAIPSSTIKLGNIVFQGIACGKLGTYFFGGSLVASFWQLIYNNKLNYAVAIVAFAFASTHVFGTANPILALCISLFSILLGMGSWGRWFNKGGDPSYGMYIFGFPIQQLALISFEKYYFSLAFSLVTAVAIGYTTYWIFERRCIKARGSLASILRWPFR